MDGVSAAASILAIGTAGVQVSIKLFSLAKQYSAASDRISAISGEVNFTSSVLKELGTLMSQKPTEDSLSPGEESLSIFSESSLQITTASAKICDKVIQNLQGMLRKASKQIDNDKENVSREEVTLSRTERVKWLFQQPQLNTLRKDLGKAKDSLVFVLQLTTLAYARKVAELNRPATLTADEQQDLKQVILTLWNERRNTLEAARILSASDRDVVKDIQFSNESSVNPDITATQTTMRALPSPRISLIDISTGPRVLCPNNTQSPDVLAGETLGEAQSRNHPAGNLSPRGQPQSLNTPSKSIRSIRQRDASVDSSSRHRLWPSLRFSWGRRRRSRKRSPSPDRDNYQELTFRVYFQKPQVRDTNSGLLISWPIKEQQAITQENIFKEMARDQRRGRLSVIQQRTKLYPEEDERISHWLQGLPLKAELISMKRMVSNITHNGIVIRKVPSIRFIVMVGSERHHREIEIPVPPGNVISLSRPTYIKIHRKHIDPETLDAYQLPWEWDEGDATYIVVKQWIPEHDQDVLFEHTRKLREKRQITDTATLLKKERDQLLLVRRREPRPKKSSRSHSHLYPSVRSSSGSFLRSHSRPQERVPQQNPQVSPKRSSSSSARWTESTGSRSVSPRRRPVNPKRRSISGESHQVAEQPNSAPAEEESFQLGYRMHDGPDTVPEILRAFSGTTKEAEDPRDKVLNELLAEYTTLFDAPRNPAPRRREESPKPSITS